MLKQDSTVLRAPEDRDEHLLLTLRNDATLQLMLASRPRANSTERVRSWLSGLLTDPGALFFVIADGAGPALGYIQLTKMDLVNRTAELGICVAEAERGTGHAKLALALIENHARDVFGIRKVILTVLATNQRAIQFYRKALYLDVGVYRQHFFMGGTFHDVLIMEKLLVAGS